MKAFGSTNANISSGYILTGWMLIAGFLLQPVLTYLVTPIVGHDQQGEQVVICTLQGQKVITLDFPTPGEESGAEHCPALKLYQMAGATQVSMPPVMPVVSLYAVELLDQTAALAHRTLHFSAYASRAPPVA